VTARENAAVLMKTLRRLFGRPTHQPTDEERSIAMRKEREAAILRQRSDAEARRDAERRSDSEADEV
jgi:hypothetical protein